MLSKYQMGKDSEESKNQIQTPSSLLPERHRTGLGHRGENYHVPGYGILANSYLRLNEASDTPRAKHIPKHLLFLRDFTKNPSGPASNGCKSLAMTLANSLLFYWKRNNNNKKSCSFAKHPGFGGVLGTGEIQIEQDLL